MESALPPPTGTRFHTAQEWEDIRLIFTKLYQVEDRTLKDVIDILAERHDFRATCVQP
jgi:hypothetical protein